MEEGRITIWEKHLLFRDLCMRASYNVVVALRNTTVCDDGTYQKEPSNVRLRGVHAGNDWKPYSGYGVILENNTAYYDLDSWEVKPYVRPLTAMSDQEKEVYNKMQWHRKERFPLDSVEEMDFLIRNHFDVFNLLNYDLAIELTPENSPYEPKFKVGDCILSIYDDMSKYTIENITDGYYILDQNMQLLVCRQNSWKVCDKDGMQIKKDAVLED